MTKALCYGGPHNGEDVWINYRKSAERHFADYGLEVASAFNDCPAIGQITSPELVFFYVLAHCSYKRFQCGPSLYCTVAQIEDHLKDRGRMGFAFLGNCWSHVKTGPGTTSFAFRKGKIDVTTIGYYKAEKSLGWRVSLPWQERLFSYLGEGLTFGEAFDEAVADYPEIANMVRIAGNRNLTLEEAKKIREKEEEEVGENKLKSRKLWMAVAGIITSLAVCFGLDVEPETTAAIAGGLFALYIVMQGIVDSIKR